MTFRVECPDKFLSIVESLKSTHASRMFQHGIESFVKFHFSPIFQGRVSGKSKVSVGLVYSGYLNMDLSGRRIHFFNSNSGYEEHSDWRTTTV